MSIEATMWALSSTVGTQGDRDAATRKLVLFGYANHAHKDGRNAWAGKGTIAGYAECDKRTVQRHVKRLLADGWLREGDQTQVEHIRADRRPVVYDLAMTDTVKVRWAAAHAAGDSSWASEQRGDPWWARGDNLSPRHGDDHEPLGGARGDTTLSPRTDPRGVTDGVTPNAPRGDTAVSPEPSLNQEETPQPPASGGRIDVDSTTTPPRCARPGPKPHDNCRGCRTTGRQLEEQAKRDAAAAQRAADQADWRAQIAEQRAAATPPPPELRDRVRQLTSTRSAP